MNVATYHDAAKRRGRGQASHNPNSAAFYRKTHCRTPPFFWIYDYKLGCFIEIWRVRAKHDTF
jgi:hypothetical protein